jgi:hypothetical protein
MSLRILSGLPRPRLSIRELSFTGLNNSLWCHPRNILVSPPRCPFSNPLTITMSLNILGYDRASLHFLHHLSQCYHFSRFHNLFGLRIICSCFCGMSHYRPNDTYVDSYFQVFSYLSLHTLSVFLSCCPHFGA